MHGSGKVESVIQAESQRPWLANDSLDVSLPMKHRNHLQRLRVGAIDHDVIGKSSYRPKTNRQRGDFGSPGAKQGVSGQAAAGRHNR
jgi:hypothetical protein